MAAKPPPGPPEPPSVADLVRANPALAALLALSAVVSLWAATRRAPKPEVIPAAIEPVVEIPAAPEQEPEPAPYVFPPAPEPEARPAPVQRAPDAKLPPPPASGIMHEDGTFEPSGRGLP